MKKSGKSSGTSGSGPEEEDDFRRKFGELSLNKKLTTLMQLEAATMSEALNTIIDKSISAGEDVMDQLAGRASRKDAKK